jgi:hypothetical protein
MYIFRAPQVLGWAACKCQLHCPGPSLLRATSRLSPQYQADTEGGKVLKVEEARPLLHMCHAGYISATH